MAGRFRFKNNIKDFRITSGATTSGPTGQALSMALTANSVVEEWGVESGANGIIDGAARVALIDVATAGAFPILVYATRASDGQRAQKIITLTLSGSASLGQLQGFVVADTAADSITFNFTALAGATSYEVLVDGTIKDLTVSKILAVQFPDTDYSCQGRGVDSAVPPNYGAWSSPVQIAHTDAVVVPPAPPPNTQAVRARVYTNSMMLQFHFNWASNDPHTQYDGANGWFALIAPFAAAGVKRIRTATGPFSSETIQGVILARRLYDDYGFKFNFVVAAETTESPSTTTIVQRVHTRLSTRLDAVQSFESLNEANNPSGALYSTWKDRVIDHPIAMHTAKSAYGDWGPAILGFSNFKRNSADITALLAHTTPGGKTWVNHVLPLLRDLTLHWYTGGRLPTIGGTPSPAYDDGGHPVLEVTLDDVLEDLRLLAPGQPSFPVSITESGWLHADPTLSDRQLSQAAVAKFNQRMVLEGLLRGINTVTHFEWFDNPNDLSKIYGMLDWTLAGGVYTWILRDSYHVQLRTAQVMYDAGATAETFTPGVLSFSLGDAGTPGHYDADIHHMLFQLADGTFRLPIVWNKQSWLRTSPFGDASGTRSIRLTLGSAKVVSTYRPYLNDTETVLNGGVPATVFDLTVPDDLLVVKVLP